MSAIASPSSRTEAAAGLFAPGSISRRVDREALVLAGGTCALLLQVAHPAVAAGVDAHSDFRDDPFARLRRTLGTSWAIAFGDRSTAERAIGRINAVHRVVNGVVTETGRPYRALDPELLLWVHATLVDTALRMHDRFIARLSPDEMDTYHREAAEIAIRLGVPERMIPASLADLRAWMDARIASGEVRVGPTARSLAPFILYPTAFPPRVAWDAAHLASISILDPRVRRQYGLPWNARRDRGVARLAAVSRRLYPLLPTRVRHVPPARVRAG